MAASVHVEDIGTVFEATILESGAALNIAAATTRQLWFRRPDGRVLKKTATLTSTGLDGRMQYTTVTDDLSHAGKWSWQAYLVFSTGTWYSDIQTFDVVRHL